MGDFALGGFGPMGDLVLGDHIRWDFILGDFILGGLSPQATQWISAVRSIEQFPLPPCNNQMSYPLSQNRNKL